MQLTVKSTKFQEMISKASKGCSNDKMIPITSLMGISLTSGTLSLKTTDGTNWLTVMERGFEGEDFSVVVSTELFIKLIMKMTCEKITVDLNEVEKQLSVRGNGNYSIQLPLNEEGELITWPKSCKLGESVSETYTIKPANFRKVISANKAALAVTLEMPFLTQYFVDSKRVVSCDSLVVCENKESLMLDNVLLSQPFMDLVSLIGEEEAEVTVFSQGIRISSATMEILGKLLYDVESYPIAGLQTFFDDVFPFAGKLNRVSLISILDRLDLFVSNNDEKGIYINFTDKGVLLKSKKGSATEFLPYEEPLVTNTNGAVLDNPTYCINLKKFADQLNSQTEVFVQLGFGNNNAIRIRSANLTHVVSLIEDRT